MNISKVKICQSCGRPMEYRKKWRDSWDQVKFCSKACRSRGVPESLMRTIEALVDQRGRGKTICPSEVLDGDDRSDRKKMELVRNAARLLAHSRKIVISQGGRKVDPADFKGPIRLGKP